MLAAQLGSDDRRECAGGAGLADLWRHAFGRRRLILVSNRGPVEHVVAADGTIKATRGSGGVVTALAALTRDVGCTWIAAAMTDGDRRVAAAPRAIPVGDRNDQLAVRLLALPDQVYERYYGVFANTLLWFLQHYLLDLAYGAHLDQASRRAWDQGYVPANRAFAGAIRDVAARDAEPPVVLTQDYHLYLVARFARELGVRATFQHFVHIPWPAPEYWAFLPRDMRRGICDGLAANDVVGFQTPVSAYNFLQTCDAVLDEARVDLASQTIQIGDHLCQVRVYPISIDVAALRELADQRAVRRYRAALAKRTVGKTIVRVDRLEPSKNVLRGFEAYARLLERHPELVGAVTFLAFLVPSRTRLAEYRRYRQAVWDAVERIQARFGTADWRPVEVVYENNYAQAIAGMSLADVLLVNPIADGMNLVAKEGPIVNQRDGVLVLSEGAGAYHQLAEGALSIAPGDVEGTAEALYRALTLPAAERAAWQRRLRQGIESEDLAWWIRRQVEDLARIRAPAAAVPVRERAVAAPALAAPARGRGDERAIFDAARAGVLSC